MRIENSRQHADSCAMRFFVQDEVEQVLLQHHRKLLRLSHLLIPQKLLQVLVRGHGKHIGNLPNRVSIARLQQNRNNLVQVLTEGV
jgi:hypothetical protein